MSKFARFWKKDLLNKLIVLVVLLIATAVAGNILLFMKNKSSGSALLADLFPTPTTELKVILTRNAATEEYQSAMATASVPPTITTMPFTPRPSSTMLPALGSTLPAFTPGALSVTSTPTQTLGLACFPVTAHQVGKVVDIVDGYTIKVIMDGLVYTVRYAGVELPEDVAFADQASALNARLVYGKTINLVADVPDKDQNGRLLRYVIVDDKFVNLELLQQGLAITLNTDPLLACADLFNTAQQSAMADKRGFWKSATAP